MYVKFISKNGEWFDAGTEVFDFTICDWGRTSKRIPKEDYENIWVKAGHILGRGFKEWFLGRRTLPIRRI